MISGAAEAVDPVFELKKGKVMKVKPFIQVTIVILISMSVATEVWAQKKVIESDSQDATEVTRSDYVSDASFVVGTYKPASGDYSVASSAAAAKAFIAKLTADQQNRIKHDLQSAERRAWTNLPAPVDAGGVRMGDMSDEQVKAACDLMAAILSEQGYNKIRDIMLADDQLLDGGEPRRGFGTENFSLVVFGEPSETEPWCVQVDGHHVGVNVSVSGAELTIAPSFIGTQPEAFKIAGESFEPFAGETGHAYELVSSLTDEQVKQAVLRPKRQKILTGPGNDGKTPAAKGLPCSSLNDAQKKVLLKLIGNWVNDLPKSHAAKRMEEIAAEVDSMTFAWNGNREPGSDISYTIQSPSLIIEYACQNLGGNPLAHLHSMYRNPKNDYGNQLE